MLDLDLEIEKLPRVGSSFAKRLGRLGIFKLRDLLYHFPFRYEDASRISPIANLKPGSNYTVTGEIWQIKNIRTARGKFLTTAQVADKSGVLEVVWFNQPFLTRNLKAGQKVNLFGKLGEFNKHFVLYNPEYELLTAVKEKLGTVHTGRIVPIYEETRGLSSKWLRARVDAIFKENSKLDEYLPEEILREERLLRINEAIREIHFPTNFEKLSQARERLSFEELFLLQAQAYYYKNTWAQRAKTKSLTISDNKLELFQKSLPFELTNAQKRAVEEIRQDLRRGISMNRLLEGDVGSGKTVVAGVSAYIAHSNKTQSIILAPTEVLAFQHHKTLTHLLSNFGVRVDLITGSRKPKQLRNLGNIVVGTHALLQEKIIFGEVGLLVIDEQHRFGVAQRALLRTKSKTPHILTMTATPIPRSLALTLYGDLDLSVIDELPKNRLKVATFLVPKEKRTGAYEFIKKRASLREQTFIICPFIEPSETLQSVKSATLEFERLQKEVFPGLRLGLLHGRLRSKQKEEILADFKSGGFQILVATPVVEVGIDIPGATIMMIEAAERFGLAGLHQLRGRVGRANLASFCLLFTETTNPKVLERLRLLTRYYSGIELAEMDLKMRGPGELFGTAQSGLINLKIADLSDLSLIERTRSWVSKVFEKKDLEDYPYLKEVVVKEPQTVSPD